MIRLENEDQLHRWNDYQFTERFRAAETGNCGAAASYLEWHSTSSGVWFVAVVEGSPPRLRIGRKVDERLRQLSKSLNPMDTAKIILQPFVYEIAYRVIRKQIRSSLMANYSPKRLGVIGAELNETIA